MDNQQPYTGPTVSVPAQSEIAAFVLGVLPFVCSFSSSSTTTVNGQVTSRSETDYLALAAGAIVVALALYSFTLLGRTADEDKIKRYGVMVVLVGLGVLQVLRGLGVFTAI